MKMIRALARLFAMFFLAIAVIMAVVDAARSLAADELLLTSLGGALTETLPAFLENLRQMASDTHPLAETLLRGLMDLPGAAVFMGLALLLFVAGRKPRHRHDPFVLRA